MDYVRKRRNVTYHSDSCKMYLRHDFNHKCAYCGAIEEAISFIPETADKFFEKDHFLPQHDGTQGMHDYPNLYYSCTSCNNKKDSITLPLNPCSHNIYSGENPHVQGGTPETDYILRGITPEGKEYIAALELNSRYHLSIRQKQHAWLCAKTESWKILQDLQNSGKVNAADLKQIAEVLKYPMENDRIKCACGGSKYAVAFADACHYLASKGYNPEVIFEEHEMDIKVAIGANTYWGSIRISDSIKECRIKTTVLEERRKKNAPYGLFVYIPTSATMCFYEIDFDAVDWTQKQHRTSSFVCL